MPRAQRRASTECQDAQSDNCRSPDDQLRQSGQNRRFSRTASLYAMRTCVRQMLDCPAVIMLVSVEVGAEAPEVYAQRCATTALRLPITASPFG